MENRYNGNNMDKVDFVRQTTYKIGESYKLYFVTVQNDLFLYSYTQQNKYDH